MLLLIPYKKAGALGQKENSPAQGRNGYGAVVIAEKVPVQTKWTHISQQVHSLAEMGLQCDRALGLLSAGQGSLCVALRKIPVSMQTT